MKRILMFVAIVAACLQLCQEANAQSKRQGMMMGIAFYNLENLFDTINNNGKYDLEFSPNGSRQWDGRKYWSKINKLADAISHFTTKNTPFGPAIIGISEIENESVVRDLVNAAPIKKWGLKYVHHDSPDRRGVDVGLLYNPKFFKVESVTNTTLAIPENPTFRTRDQMCVVGKLMGQPLAVIVNHYPSRLGGQEQSSYLREAAAALSKHIADSLWQINPDMGVVIMGDMNDDPYDKSMAKVLGAARDREGVEPHGFFNPFWSILDKGIGTLAYKGQWNLFDQIVISGNLANGPADKFHFLRALVHNFEFLRDKEGSRKGYPLRTFASGSWLDGYSDHFPTEILLVKEFVVQ
ncbi:MAG: endonuclease/exonuclease/phosphatase family protein [Muribaculaceae bacterium]|nr:endonuclease/exonuclease/phosphatase family protein [Muribaculaceae bacterium]